MKVAVIEFPTKCLIGVVDDPDAEAIAVEFGDVNPEEEASPLGPNSEGEQEGRAIIRLQYPARNETANWFQPGPLAGEQQFVVQNFVALIGSTRMTVDLGAALAGDVFETTDSQTALISVDGIRPAGGPASDEPIVQRYLAALAGAGVKAGRPGGRHKVQPAG